MKDYPGLGPAKACEIIACFELGKRLLKGKKARIYLKSKEVWEELKDIRDNKKEHFVILYLDSRNQEIKREIISVGSLNANLVHPREVFEPAVKNLAAQIILAHNHPSGNPEPSEDDLTITKRVVEAGKIMGIKVIESKKVNPQNNPTRKIKYIDLADINPSTGEIESYSELYGYEAPSRARMVIKKGAVLVASLSGSLSNVGLVPAELDNEVASTGFFVINSENYLSDFLHLLFRSEILKNQLEQKTAGAIMAAVP